MWTRSSCSAMITRSADVFLKACRWTNALPALNRRIRSSFTTLRAATLEKALRLGYRDFAWLAKDPDLKKLRAQPAYRSLKEKIQRLKKKAG